MKRIRYWLTSKRLLMAQLHDIQRQLQEAWDDKKYYSNLCGDWAALYRETCLDKDNMRVQLHRLSRERYQERELRLEAEELRDEYLEQLENEEE